MTIVKIILEHIRIKSFMNQGKMIRGKNMNTFALMMMFIVNVEFVKKVGLMVEIVAIVFSVMMEKCI